MCGVEARWHHALSLAASVIVQALHGTVGMYLEGAGGEVGHVRTKATYEKSTPCSSSITHCWSWHIWQHCCCCCFKLSPGGSSFDAIGSPRALRPRFGNG